MNNFRTVASVIIMVIAGIVGFFVGAYLSDGSYMSDAMGGAILFSLISGNACLIYTIDNPEK